MKLFIKEAIGQYREAKPSEIFAVAKENANAMLAKGELIDSPWKLKDFLTAQLMGLEHEVFGIVLMNAQHQIMGYRELFRGTVDACSVHVREVAKVCLAMNASAICLVHNHPSGCIKESPADLAITKKLKDSLAVFDIRTLDHFIVAGSETMSFAEKGLI